MNSYTVDREKWAKLTIFEQMGNICSEVGRTLKAKQLGQAERMQGALWRGLDLFDATAEVWAAKKSPRTKEILRAREQFVEAASTSKDDPGLENYFMQFSMAARLNQKRQFA